MAKRGEFLSKEVLSKISEGFEIKCMKLKDAATNEMFWERLVWPKQKLNLEEDEEEEKSIEVHFPKRILDVKELSRTIEFSTKEKIENL